MDGDLRIAIIGCGPVAELAHLPAAVRVRGGRITLLVDPNATRREQLARMFNVERTAADARECPDSFDAAIVAAPHTLHAPHGALESRWGSLRTISGSRCRISRTW